MMEPQETDFIPRDYSGPTGGMVMNTDDCLSYLDWVYTRSYGSDELHLEEN